MYTLTFGIEIMYVTMIVICMLYFDVLSETCKLPLYVIIRLSGGAIGKYQNNIINDEYISNHITFADYALYCVSDLMNMNSLVYPTAANNTRSDTFCCI